jgi:O-antigen/teichoic acid export membrane protein
MVIHDTIGISSVMIAFMCLGLALVCGLLVVMRLRHKYHPNLIGALIGAMLCFLLLEALPALT